MIAAATTPDERAPAYALLTTALAVGNTGAGLIAAAVGQSSLRWLFVVDAASCLACALIVARLLPAEHPALSAPAGSPDGGGDSGSGSGAADRGPSPWRDLALLAMTAAGTAFALVYMLLLVALPLALTADGSNPASAGLVLAVATLTIVLARPLLRLPPLAGLSAGTASGAGFLLMAAGLAGYAAAHSLIGLLGPTAVWSIGSLLLTGRAFAVVTSLAPAGATARYLAVYGLSWGVATVAAPVLATQVTSWPGPAALWLGSGALCLVMAGVQPWLLRRLGRRPHPAVATGMMAAAERASPAC